MSIIVESSARCVVRLHKHDHDRESLRHTASPDFADTTSPKRRPRAGCRLLVSPERVGTGPCYHGEVAGHHRGQAEKEEK